MIYICLCNTLYNFIYVYVRCLDLRQPAENLLQAPWLLKFGATGYEGCVHVVKEWISELTDPGYKGEEKNYGEYNDNDIDSGYGGGTGDGMDMDYKSSYDYKK